MRQVLEELQEPRPPPQRGIPSVVHPPLHRVGLRPPLLRCRLNGAAGGRPGRAPAARSGAHRAGHPEAGFLWGGGWGVGVPEAQGSAVGPGPVV